MSCPNCGYCPTCGRSNPTYPSGITGPRYNAIYPNITYTSEGKVTSSGDFSDYISKAGEKK